MLNLVSHAKLFDVIFVEIFDTEVRTPDSFQCSGCGLMLFPLLMSMIYKLCLTIQLIAGT